MYDIITFGSATQDIHVTSKQFKVLKDEKDFITGEGICLPFGSKVEVEDIIFSSGGGGTNTAATFAKQGFKTAFCGAIGADISGLEMVRELKHLRIDTKFIIKKKEKHTSHSVILSNTGDDRTILVYRGAAEMVSKKDILWKKLNTKWMYLAPLSGLLCDQFEELVNFAAAKNIKIAVNMSVQQLELPRQKLKEILKKVEVIFLNQEEASLLTGIPFQNEKEIFSKLEGIFSGISVMTRGAQGVVASDGKYVYAALPNLERSIVDTTGAGDSFASGFLSDYIRHNGNIEKAIQLGLANSAGNLSQLGAKTGLLGRDDKFTPQPVTKQLCTDNNLCFTK